MRLLGVRQLDEYPGGLRRLWLLAMAVLAVLIGSYEAQIAPVVPLLIRDLDLDLATYGSVAAVAAVAGAIAAFVGGRLTDHLGRVRLLVPLMMVTALCCFAMTLVDSTRELLIARTVLAFVDGMALASTAPLVRDFSPRTGRAQAFGFWTWGPVGASLLAAGLAAWTLPIFANSWRSQFVLMGLISLVMSALIAGTIADLSPELRARIQQSAHTALPARHRAGPARTRDLLTHRRLWAHGVGISLWLVLYLSLAAYGPTMLVTSFGVSSAKAAGIMTAFWAVDLAVLVVVGRISDRLQLRKPFALGGTLAAALAAGYLLVLMGRASVSTGQLMTAGAVLGAALAVAYGPWMANYSEDAEDVDPRLQGTAWGIFGLLSRTTAVVVVLVVPRIVAAASWRAWLSIALACLVLFVPAVFAFGGPWRRAPRPAEGTAARLTPVAGGADPERAGNPARV
jgi:OPA family glycerol-3-phosphate transporter-like MFS transporter